MLHWVCATTAMLIAAAVFNALVDPYGIFGIVDLRGFNEIKTRAGQRAEMYKRHAAVRLKGNGLVLGNSRAEIGFDPDSPEWPKAARPVFNYALPGSGLEAAQIAFSEVARAKAPKFVVVGVEFLDFRTQGVPTRLSGLDVSRTERWAKEHVGALLTIDALLDSVLTIAGQHRIHATSLTKSGFNPMRDYEQIASREGYHAMFAQRNQDNARAYAVGPKDIRGPDGRLAPEFDMLSRLVTDALAHGAEVKLVLYPYHAHTLVLFHECGLWGAFEQWKRELVSLVGRFDDDARVSLWDFAYISPFTEEAVPASPEARVDMRWYWESGHFKKSLGDKVLARIFATADEDVLFGVRLSSATIDDVLGEARKGLAHYVITHSTDLAQLQKLVQEGQRGSKGGSELRHVVK